MFVQCKTSDTGVRHACRSLAWLSTMSGVAVFIRKHKLQGHLDLERCLGIIFSLKTSHLVLLKVVATTSRSH